MSMVFMSAFSLMQSLEVEEPAGRGLDPFLLRIFVEYEPLVGGGDAPRAGRHLEVELTGAPAGIAQTEHRPARAGAGGDRLEDPRIVGDREVIVKQGRALARPVRRVQDEAAALVDGASVVDADGAAARRHLEAERPERALDWNLAERQVDHQPERTLRLVPHDVDDRAGEARIA